MPSLRNPRGRCSGLETHYQSTMRWKFGVFEKRHQEKPWGAQKRRSQLIMEQKKKKYPYFTELTWRRWREFFEIRSVFAGPALEEFF